MATQYVPLSPVELLPEELQITHPAEMPELIYIEDPATYGLLDFQRDEPRIVKEDNTIDEIHIKLRKANAHDILVLDDDERLCGILHSADLQGVKPAQIMQSKRIDKNEVTAGMLMTPLKEILCLHYDEILHARIGNLIASLIQQHRQYALAIESNKETGQQTVRGLVSAWRLGEQLGEDIQHYS